MLDGDRKRRMRDHDDERARNYELAGLISYAHHEPKKMPKFKPTEDPNAEKSDELAQAQVRGYFMALAISAKKSPRRGHRDSGSG